MKKRQNNLEHFIDKIIPYLVLILLIIIVGDLLYSEPLEKYAIYIHTIDWIIIIIFAIDLIFKYRRVRNVKNFIKKYWLEIIAIIPFYLAIRVVEEIFLLTRISEAVSEGQKILHEGVEISKLSNAERLARTERISRLFKPFQRVPRLLESAKFFEKPEK